MAQLSYSVPTAPQTVTNMAWNDPYFALGYLGAQLWNKNYNERGIDKLMKSVEGSIPDYEGQNAALDSVKQSTPITEVNGNVMNSILTDMANEHGTIGEATPMSDVSKIALALPKTGNAVEDTMNNLTMQAVNNPEAAQAVAAPQTTQTLTPFYTDDWKAKIQAEGVRQGRPQEQIDAVIERLLPQAQQAEKKYKQSQSAALQAEIMSNLPSYGEDGKLTGDPDKVISALIRLGEADPAAAKVLSAQIIGPKEVSNNNLQTYRTNDARTYQEQQQEKALERAAARGYGYGGGSSSRGGSSSHGGSDADSTAADTVSYLHDEVMKAIQGDNDYRGAVISKIEDYLASDEAKKAKIPQEVRDELTKEIYVLNAYRQAAINDWRGDPDDVANGLNMGAIDYAQYIPKYEWGRYNINELLKGHV